MNLKHLRYKCLNFLIIGTLVCAPALAGDDSLLDGNEAQPAVTQPTTKDSIENGSPAEPTEINTKESVTPNSTSKTTSDEVVTPKTSDSDTNSEDSSLSESTSDETSTSDTSNLSVDNSDTSDPIDIEQATAISMLGNSVEPGEAAILKWVFAETFVDSDSSVPVLVVNGVNPGPTLCLTAAVHGDELNGIEIVRRVVHEVDAQKLSGAVIGVPIVNFEAFRRATRYLPDRRDLNRYFPGNAQGSHASRIAYSFFYNVIAQCDFLIDLHTGSLSRTNLPQIRANLLDPDVASLAEKMGSIVVLQSQGATGSLRRAASEFGVPSVTIEAGAPNNLQKDAVESGVKSVLNALSELGLTPAAKPFWKNKAEPVFYQSVWIRAKTGGVLFSKIALGDRVKKDTVLGLISDPITNKTDEVIAPFEGRVIGMALNQVMYPGYAAYHIGLKSSVKEATQPAEVETDVENIDVSEQAIDADTKLDTLDPTETAVDSLNTPEVPQPEKEPIEDMELPTIEE